MLSLNLKRKRLCVCYYTYYHFVITASYVLNILSTSRSIATVPRGLEVDSQQTGNCCRRFNNNDKFREIVDEDFLEELPQVLTESPQFRMRCMFKYICTYNLNTGERRAVHRFF